MTLEEYSLVPNEKEYRTKECDFSSYSTELEGEEQRFYFYHQGHPKKQDFLKWEI